MQRVACLNVPGTAREAMDFHAEALGGEVAARFTDGESPTAAEMPERTRCNIMHSQLTARTASLMGADGPPPHAPGSTTVNIMPDTPEEAERIFSALSSGGEITMPLRRRSGPGASARSPTATANTGW